MSSLDPRGAMAARASRALAFPLTQPIVPPPPDPAQQPWHLSLDQVRGLDEEPCDDEAAPDAEDDADARSDLGIDEKADDGAADARAEDGPAEEQRGDGTRGRGRRGK